MHEKTLLRIFTCGSVDDGKSTLIGRILYDCGTLYEDQLAQLEETLTHEGLPDFSSLLDGLLAEQEQAITIDVAYRSFSTATRRYIVADAPGHEQYTRNMATAASNAELALILIDVEQVTDNLLPQTKRHTYISSLLGIPDVVFVINKMDLCGYSKDVFDNISTKCQELIKDLNFRSATCIPVSALKGDNVRYPSKAMPWYNGPTVLDILETTIPVVRKNENFRMPVQWVARTSTFRGLAGTIISGTLNVGQAVLAQPSGKTSTVKSIVKLEGGVASANAEEAVCLELADDLDISRGEILTTPEFPLEIADQFAAKVVWLNDPPLVSGRSYIFRQATTEAMATVTALSYSLDLESMCEAPAQELSANGIGKIKIVLNRSLPFTTYTENHDLGGFLLIDRLTGRTLGAGMIEYALRRSHNVRWHQFALDKATYATQKNQKPCVLWFTGLSASGKSTLADYVAKELFARGNHVYLLDGDNLRHGLNRDLGFTEHDRSENIRRAGEAAHLLVDAGLIVLATFISPYKTDRAALRDLFAPEEYFEIFVDTPLETCIKRDPKGLYAKALAGDIPNFTAISAPFERPTDADLTLQGDKPIEELVEEILAFFDNRCAAQ